MLTDLSNSLRMWRTNTPMIRSENLLNNLGNPEATFETFMVTVRDTKVLRRAKACLQMAIAASATPPTVAMVNVREFLAAWVIDRFTNRVLVDAEHYTVLVNAAKKMVRSFTAFLEQTTNGGTSDEFIADFNAYMPLFESWREADSALLTDRIDKAIHDLNDALELLTDDSPPELEGMLRAERARLQEKRLRLTQ